MATLQRTVDIFDSVEAMLDRDPAVAGVFEHKLHLFAARRAAQHGASVPKELADAATVATMSSLAARPLLERICSVYDGPLVLFKGPEVALRYPDPVLRPYGDLDVLVADAEAVHAALKRAGFEEVGDPRLYVDIHHLRPLQWPALPLAVEIHSRVKWPEGSAAPPTDVLLAAAVPARFGPALTLAPAHHALVLAAHAWAHEPLLRILDLVDVALLAGEADRRELEELAERWDLQQIWRATDRAIEAVLYGGRPSFELRTWARSLADVRGRSVFESHLQQWIGDFSAFPPAVAVRRSIRAALRDLQPMAGEPWRNKLHRAVLALRRRSESRAVHERDLVAKGLPTSPWDLPDRSRSNGSGSSGLGSLRESRRS